jgi:hypothetical protein
MAAAANKKINMSDLFFRKMAKGSREKFLTALFYDKYPLSD